MYIYSQLSYLPCLVAHPSLLLIDTPTQNRTRRIELIGMFILYLYICIWSTQIQSTDLVTIIFVCVTNGLSGLYCHYVVWYKKLTIAYTDML